MKVLKWLDDHFEETLLIFLLVVISCVELLQVVCRNVPFVPSLTWAEELCRFAWIATVFLSLPYTVRTNSTLRVTALLDLLPWRLRNILNVLVDVVTFAILAILTNASVSVLERVVASGELSPAMLLPMWIMYVIVLVGFALGALRSVQMFIIHIRHFNEPPRSTVEEQAEFELAGELHDDEASVAESAPTGEKGGA